MVKAIKACFISIALIVGLGTNQTQATVPTDNSYLIITCAENGSSNVLVTAESQMVFLVINPLSPGPATPEVGQDCAVITSKLLQKGYSLNSVNIIPPGPAITKGRIVYSFMKN